jgi:predicted Zn-dependent protease
MGARAPRLRAASVALALAVTLAGCSSAADEPGFNLFTPEEDVKIGKESADKVRAELPVLENTEIEAYLEAVGAKLAAFAPGEKYPYTFTVLDVRDVNAFAMPGGIVFVNRGTLETVKDEGELAGVIAHEISHVALRHGTSQMSKAYVAQKGFDILRRLGGGGARPGDANEVAEAVGGLGLNTLFLKFSRDAESQADAVGARMLAEAGYDPIEMARFFDNLPRGANAPSFLSDHPALGDRATAVAELRATLPVSKTPITLTDAFWKMKSELTLLPRASSMLERRVGPNGE